jgi:hypothetical protein
MKKLILAALAASLMAASGRADTVDLSAHAGFTSLSMGNFNKANSAFWGWSGVGHVNELDSGFIVGLDATTKRLTRFDWLDLGLRGEYLQSDLAVNDSLASGGNKSYVSDQANLGGLLIGAKAEAPFVDDRLTAGLGLWAGMGYATMAQAVGYSQSALSNGVYTTYLPVGEAEASLRYRLGSRWSLTASTGWRWADAASLKDSRGVPLYQDLQLWKYGVKSPLNVDYSGATAQGAASYSF